MKPVRKRKTGMEGKKRRDAGRELDDSEMVRMRDAESVAVGIDPDAEENGVAVIADGRASLRKLSFPRLVAFLTFMRRRKMRIVIEAGWLNKPNWHPAKNLAVAAAIGNRTVRNHETGRKLAEMLDYYKIPYELRKPLRKIWRGQGRKITHEELRRLLRRRGIELLDNRTNQDARDACLLIL